MQPVPIRPHNPLPLATATIAEFLTYRNNEANAQIAWDLLHPNDKIMNHRPTDSAIKGTSMLALGSSTFPPYSNLAQRYHQIDHANKTWTDLRTDIESNISNNFIGTSRDSAIRHRQHDRPSRDWRHSPSYFDPSTASESRSSQIPYDNYRQTNRKKKPDPPNTGITHDIRAAIPTGQPNTPTQLYPCANCAGDHRATDCDSTKCFTCQANFPTAALRQAHYLSTHRRDSASKRARFAPIHTPARGHHTPPSSPFLSRSVTEMHNPSPYDSGYDSSFSTASGPGQPLSSRGNSDIDDQVDRYIRDQRVVTIVHDPSAPDDTHTQPPRAPLPPNHIDITRLIDQRHRTFTHHTDRSPHSIPARDPENAQESPTAPTLSDSDDSTSSPPPLIDDSSDEDDTYDRHPEISDDARNAIHRRYAHMQTRRLPLLLNPSRLTNTGHTIFDIRVATHDSDSTPIYSDPSDSSDADTPHYWPEITNPTPPSIQLTTPGNHQ